MTPFPTQSFVLPAATYTVVGDFVCDQADYLSLQISNNGNNPLTAFEVWVKVNRNAPLVKIAASIADMTTGSLLFEGVTTAVESLANGSSAIVVLKPIGIYSVELRATSASGTVLQIDASAFVKHYFD